MAAGRAPSRERAGALQGDTVSRESDLEAWPVLSPRGPGSPGSCSEAAALEGGVEAADRDGGFCPLLLPVYLRLYPLCQASCCLRAWWGAVGAGLAPPEPGGPSLALCPSLSAGASSAPDGLHLVTFQERAPALATTEPGFLSRGSWGSLGRSHRRAAP